MTETFSPTLLLASALLLGVGLYFIQRGRFLVLALMRRIPVLARNPRLARYLVIALLTLGILSAGLGCRILVAWMRF
jgi:hypothetical protein